MSWSHLWCARPIQEHKSTRHVYNSNSRVYSPCAQRSYRCVQRHPSQATHHHLQPQKSVPLHLWPSHHPLQSPPECLPPWARTAPSRSRVSRKPWWPRWRRRCRYQHLAIMRKLTCLSLSASGSSWRPSPSSAGCASHTCPFSWRWGEEGREGEEGKVVKVRRGRSWRWGGGGHEDEEGKVMRRGRSWRWGGNGHEGEEGMVVKMRRGRWGREGHEGEEGKVMKMRREWSWRWGGNGCEDEEGKVRKGRSWRWGGNGHEDEEGEVMKVRKERSWRWGGEGQGFCMEVSQQCSGVDLERIGVVEVLAWYDRLHVLFSSVEGEGMAGGAGTLVWSCKGMCLMHRHTDLCIIFTLYRDVSGSCRFCGFCLILFVSLKCL